MDVKIDIRDKDADAKAANNNKVTQSSLPTQQTPAAVTESTNLNASIPASLPTILPIMSTPLLFPVLDQEQGRLMGVLSSSMGYPMMFVWSLANPTEPPMYIMGPAVPLSQISLVTWVKDTRFLLFVLKESKTRLNVWNADNCMSFHLKMPHEIVTVRSQGPQGRFLILGLQLSTWVTRMEDILHAIQPATGTTPGDKILDLQTTPPHRELKHGRLLSSCLLSSTGGMIMAGPKDITGTDLRLQTFNAQGKGIAVQHLKDVHQQTVTVTQFSQDGTYLATASEKGTIVRIWHLDEKSQQWTKAFEFRRGTKAAEIHSMSFSHDNAWLVVGSDRRTIHLFCLSDVVKNPYWTGSGLGLGYLMSTHAYPTACATYTLQHSPPSLLSLGATATTPTATMATPAATATATVDTKTAVSSTAPVLVPALGGGLPLGANELTQLVVFDAQHNIWVSFPELNCFYKFGFDLQKPIELKPLSNGFLQVQKAIKMEWKFAGSVAVPLSRTPLGNSNTAMSGNTPTAGANTAAITASTSSSSTTTTTTTSNSNATTVTNRSNNLFGDTNLP